MTKDDIIKMAREAGDASTDDHRRESFTFDSYGIEHFASLVAAHEREACAVMVENYALQYAEPVWAVKFVNAIRARSQS